MRVARACELSLAACLPWVSDDERRRPLAQALKLIGGNAIVGGVIGLCSAQLGYGVDSWQYWLIAMPAAAVLAVAGLAVAFKT